MSVINTLPMYKEKTDRDKAIQRTYIKIQKTLQQEVKSKKSDKRK